MLGVLALLGSIVFTQFHLKRRNQISLVCSSNNKQLALSLKMYSYDGYQGSPWGDPATRGSMKLTNSGMVTPHYRAMSDEIGDVTKLTCPGDIRQIAKSWSALNDSNISYFINFDSSETLPRRVAFGDRRFNSTVTPATNNLLILNTNATYQWESGIHQGHGTLSYGDGSVRKIAVQELNAEFHKVENLGSRLQLPR